MKPPSRIIFHRILVLILVLILGLFFAQSAFAKQVQMTLYDNDPQDIALAVAHEVARQMGWSEEEVDREWPKLARLTHSDIYGEQGSCSGGGGRTPLSSYIIYFATKDLERILTSGTDVSETNIGGVTAVREINIDEDGYFYEIDQITWPVGLFYISVRMMVFCPMDTPVELDAYPMASLINDIAIGMGMDTWSYQGQPYDSSGDSVVPPPPDEPQSFPDQNGDNDDEPQSFPDQNGDYYDDDNDYYDDDSDYYSDDDFSFDDSGGGEFLELLLTGGGIILAGGGTLGGGYLGYRAIRNRLARRAIKKIKQMPVKSPVPAPAPPKPTPRQMPRKHFEKKVNDLSNDIDRLLEKLNKHNPAKDEVEFYKRQAKIFEHKIDVIDKFDTGTRIIKKVNDLAADTVGHFPGIGQKFRWGYYGVTNAIMKTIETGSLRKGVYEGFKSAGKKYFGDKVTDKVIKFKSIKANAPLKEMGKNSTFFRRIKRGVIRTIIEKPIQIGKKVLKLLWR